MAEPVVRARDVGITLRPPGGLRSAGSNGWTLRSVSFAIDRGEAVALLGHNGAGKTTLLRLLGGIYRPGGGTISIRGWVSPVIGFSSPFASDLTARDHLRSAAAAMGLPVNADAALEIAQLAGAADRPVRTLSTGHRARLGMVAGLLAPFDVYLLDEGLAVCDPAFRGWAIEHLRRRCGEGAVVVVAGQDLISAGALCGRGLVLREGELVLDAEMERAGLALRTDASSGATNGSVTIEEVQALPGIKGSSHRLVVGVRGVGAGMQLLVALKTSRGDILHASRSLVHETPAREQVARMEISLPAFVVPGPGAYRVAVAVVDAAGVSLATRDDGGVLHAPPSQGST